MDGDDETTRKGKELVGRLERAEGSRTEHLFVGEVGSARLVPLWVYGVLGGSLLWGYGSIVGIGHR